MLGVAEHLARSVGLDHGALVHEDEGVSTIATARAEAEAIKPMRVARTECSDPGRVGVAPAADEAAD